MNKNIACIILAAGKGERMKSALPKVLHELCGRPMLGYVLDLVKELGLKKVITVVGHKPEAVKKILPNGVKIVRQKRLQGTADAVRQALPWLNNFKGDVLVLYADNPLLTKETVKKLLAYHTKNKPDVTLLTATAEKPAGYGRILRDKCFSICGIIEEKDADDYQKEIKEINSGIIVFAKDKLALAIKYVKADNRKKEYYLTDTVKILYQKKSLIDSVKVDDLDEVLGINSRIDLAKANRIMQKRINEELMQKGVTIVDPGSTFISYGAKIGQDTVINPFTVISNDVIINNRCSIGPFAHLREGTRLKDDTAIGNFVEIVRSRVGRKSLAKHFCYLGDVQVGDAVNIGAGVVTANFDGQKKNLTVIKEEAFIGSDTIIVAPVKIGKRVITGAGSVVVKNKNIADNQTVVGIPAEPLKRKRDK